MNINRVLTFLFFHFYFNFLITSAQICSNSFCRRTEPIIRFPFRLENLQPSSCGYPGFDLFCDAFNQTLIDLPNSGTFTVQSIDYESQNVWLNDPDHCLPRRLLQLNLSTTPFNAYFHQDFTLFNCSAFDYARYRFDPIGCMSGENYTVLASSDETAIRFLESRCSLIAAVAVPVQWGFFEPVMTTDLADNIRLTWGSPRCGRCEERRGRCGLRSVNSTEIECRNAARRGIPRTARYAIVIGMSLPGFLLVLGFLYLICIRVHNSSRRRHPIMEFSMAVVPHSTTTISGLDGSTIESYPKTVLGESCRLSKPENNTCSICLSEYMPKETLRSIPECQHCFHAECIDEWLRLNPSCPVCRNSPKSSPS
ncbi:hypothetical protein BUALT_Bualt01G0080200 [Buddleja alternifolia]|uniref:RING-type E3 ubiquitin transferase n=1 Tax=Buddleja alternifolia TaxID=168488 RepID=A0AAV6Y6S6_9LAMI|nr:hypothetical protein BUALT_Bualt01G0080200 [Buddleja alternifolia]